MSCHVRVQVENVAVDDQIVGQVLQLIPVVSHKLGRVY